jgi:hypothetical protein
MVRTSRFDSTYRLLRERATSCRALIMSNILGIDLWNAVTARIEAVGPSNFETLVEFVV